MQYTKLDDETCKVESTTQVEEIHSVVGILARKAAIEAELVTVNEIIAGMQSAGIVFP